MTRKIFGVSFFLFISVCKIAFGQETYVDIMSEEIMRFNNKSYNILHLYVSGPDNYSNMPTPLIIGICNYLRENNFISAVYSASLQKIDIDQFDWDLDLIPWRGGHPIFEWMNTATYWHTIIYKSNLYIIRTREGLDIYRINIRE
jgi:hypothetical protein